MTKNNILESLIGFIIIAIAVFFGFYSYNKSNVGTASDVTQIYIDFDAVDGIGEGSDVRVSGIKVGVVDDMSLDTKTYRARVTLSVDSKIKIPEDSNAEIISAGLLGSKYVSIVPGGSDEFLNNGDRIKYSQPSISIESLIGKYIFGSSDSEGADDEDSFF